MGKKVLYEKLKNSEEGIWVSSYSGVRWEDYLPGDSEKIIDTWKPLPEDPGASKGFEIYYSPRNEEFYLRSWKHQYANNTGSRIRIIDKEEIIDLIIDEQLIEELPEEWREKLGFEVEA